MDKSYAPKDIERRQYENWEKHGYFAPSGIGDPYCIVIPPPNVTGTLHMGHAFQDTIMDALIRYHRMTGRNTLWQPGTDHAGIATQMVVELMCGLGIRCMDVDTVIKPVGFLGQATGELPPCRFAGATQYVEIDPRHVIVIAIVTVMVVWAGPQHA